MVWFEDMKKDFSKVIRETAAFVGHDLSEEQVDTLTEFLDITSQWKHGAKSMANGNEEMEQVYLSLFAPLITLPFCISSDRNEAITSTYVTRLGDFLKFLATNFTWKVAQIVGDFEGYFGHITLLK